MMERRERIGWREKERRKKEEQTDNELPTVGVCGRERDGGGCQTEWNTQQPGAPSCGSKNSQEGRRKWETSTARNTQNPHSTRSMETNDYKTLTSLSLASYKNSFSLSFLLARTQSCVELRPLCWVTMFQSRTFLYPTGDHLSVDRLSTLSTQSKRMNLRLWNPWCSSRKCLTMRHIFLPLFICDLYFHILGF